jgi:aminomethyltransferase
MTETASLKRTPLYDRHLALGGKMVNFGGWSMPVYYTSILSEHLWTRQSCSIFDVSHLGEIRVTGSGAFEFLQYRLTNDLNKLKNGKILYNLLCDEKGGVLDDILVYQNSPTDYYLIVNAAGIDRDFAALSKYASDTVRLENQSDQTACVAIQGPKSQALLERLFGFDLKDLGYYCFKEEKFLNEPVWVSRSGYTGEDGFEIFASNALILPVWDKLVDAGKKEGALAAGLGARNTLRLEAGNLLYGNDMDETTTPLEAGLGWVVSFGKGPFVGSESLLSQKEKGISRRLVGFKMLDKPIAREHYSIFKDGRKIGVVTSGSFGPSVGFNIGLGYVEKGADAPQTEIEVEIHGKRIKAQVVKLPFAPSKHKKG